MIESEGLVNKGLFGRTLMFHEVVENPSEVTGFNQRNKGKYSIDKEVFTRIVEMYGNKVSFTFDDGGKSNLTAAQVLSDHKLTGIFCISTDLIGNEGFMSMDDLIELSREHIIISHGHTHLTKPVSKNLFYNDWCQSIDFIKKNRFDMKVVCLPAGFLNNDLYQVFLELGVETIYHSARSNVLLHLLYGRKIRFIPRIIVQGNNIDHCAFSMMSLKSYLRQIINFFTSGSGD